MKEKSQIYELMIRTNKKLWKTRRNPYLWNLHIREAFNKKKDKINERTIKIINLDCICCTV